MTTVPLTSAPTTAGDIIRARAQLHPDRIAIASEDHSCTYQELAERSDRAAVAMLALGITRGERVAFLSSNRIEYYELLFGAAKAGIGLVPVNWRLARAEVANILTDASPSLLVLDPSLAGLVANLEDWAERGRLIVFDPDPAENSTPHNPDAAGRTSPAPPTWTQFLAEAPTGDPATDEPGPEDVLWQLYTSGTTGHPKGVLLTHRNFCSMVDGLADAWHFDEGCSVYVPYPAFHAVGTAWVVLSLHRGGQVQLRRGFDAEDFLRSVERNRITLTMMVPAVLQMVLDHATVEQADLSSLAHIVYGAAPISQATLAKAVRLIPTCAYIHAYGLTEATGTVTTMQWDEHRPGTERMHSCGRPFPWVEMRVVDPATGTDATVREVGEVWVRSPTVMQGYFAQPEETSAAITADGWLRTGDAGYVDEDGYLYLTDRIKDMIISGGENIYPAEVENAVYSCPGVAQCAVVGVPDVRWGETVKAIVVRTPGSTLTEAEVIAHTRSQLAHYKCPTSVDFRLDPLPLNPTGKVMRRELRDIYWSGHGSRITA